MPDFPNKIFPHVFLFHFPPLFPSSGMLVFGLHGVKSINACAQTRPDEGEFN